MRYAKLINSRPSYAPNPILVDGNWIGNPPGSVYEAEGYLPVTVAAYPSEDPAEGSFWAAVWTQTEDSVRLVWRQESDPDGCSSPTGAEDGVE